MLSPAAASAAAAMEPALRRLVERAARLPAPQMPAPWPDPAQPDAVWLASVSRLRAAHQDAALARLALLGSPPPPPPVASVRDHQVGVDGGRITVRVFRPPGDGPFPAVLSLHAGGWWLGYGPAAVDQADPTQRALCAQLGAVVLYVDYRVAPEHRFPVPLEDCYQAAAWAVGSAAELDIDADRMALLGASAGANLAAALCLLARERATPWFCRQVLLAPPVDATMAKPSISANGILPGLTERELAGCWDLYLGPQVLRTDQLASPLHAPDLRGLPAASILTARFDPLCDEGEAYARALQAAGVPVRAARFPMTHGLATPETTAGYLGAALADLTAAFGG